MSTESPKNESKSSPTEISSPASSLKSKNAALLLKGIYEFLAANDEGITAEKSKLADLEKLISRINTDDVDWNYPDKVKGREGCTLAYMACTLDDDKTWLEGLDNPRTRVCIEFIRKILESSQEIHWNAGPQDNQQKDYGVTLAYQMLSYGTDSLPKDEEERMYRKFSKISPDKIDINAGPKNKQHHQCGATLAALWCGLVHKEKRFLELPLFLTLSSQEINWEGHFTLEPIKTNMATFSIKLALRCQDIRLLDKFLEHLRTTQGRLKPYEATSIGFGGLLTIGRRSQTHIARSILNFETEHLNLLISESEEELRKYEENEQEFDNKDRGEDHKNAIELEKFFYSFLKFISIINTIRETPKQIESLDKEERQIDTSKVTDHLKTIDSPILKDICYFCAGVKFQSLSSDLAMEYFKNVSIDSPAYSQAQFELASFYIAISGASEINKVQWKKSLKKAFDAGTRHYFFRNDVPSDEKKSSTKESLSLVERISKSAITLPGEGMSVPILPEEFSTTLEEFKKSTSSDLLPEIMEEIAQLKINHLWDNLNNYRNNREMNNKLQGLEKTIELQKNIIAKLCIKTGLFLEEVDHDTKKINPLLPSPSNTSRKRKTTSGPSPGLFSSSSSALHSTPLPQVTSTSQFPLNPEAKILEKKQKKAKEEPPSSFSSSLSFTNSRD